jgi:hypothetical protein
MQTQHCLLLVEHKSHNTLILLLTKALQRRQVFLAGEKANLEQEEHSILLTWHVIDGSCLSLSVSARRKRTYPSAAILGD